MVHAAVSLSRLPAKRLINALRRKTAGGASRVRAAARGGRGAPFSTRTTLPNGDPPSVTLWGEDE